MSTLTIPANDHGQIRIFATDATLPEKTPEVLAGLFGADLDPTYVDVVRINDLGDMSLPDYIAQGYDMRGDPADLAALEGISGTAILVLSRATDQREVTLALAPGLRHVTTYSSDVKIVSPMTLPHESARGVIGDASAKPAESDARIGGMVATIALIVMCALVGLMIWVAG